MDINETFILHSILFTACSWLLSHFTSQMLCWMWPGLKPALDWSQHGARPVSPARPGHPLSLLSAGGTDSTLHPVYMSLWHTLCCSGLKCRPVWAQNNTGDTLHCVHIPSVPVCWGVVWDQLIQHPDPVTTSVGLCVVTTHPMLTGEGVTCHWHPGSWLWRPLDNVPPPRPLTSRPSSKKSLSYRV